MSESLAVPRAWIDGATRSHRRLEGEVRALTDDDVRAPSALPGWSRGHVITHIARNAEAIRGMTERAKHGEMGPMYPGGWEERDRGIGAGASRPVAELLADVESAQAALEATWASVTEDVWQTGTGYRLSGPATLADFVFIRWREVSIHTVDLASPGVDPLDAWRSLEAEYLDEEWRWTTAGLAERVPEGTVLVLSPGDRPARAYGKGPEVVVNHDPVPQALAWLTGRADPPLPLQPW